MIHPSNPKLKFFFIHWSLLGLKIFFKKQASPPSNNEFNIEMASHHANPHKFQKRIYIYIYKSMNITTLTYIRRWVCNIFHLYSLWWNRVHRCTSSEGLQFTHNNCLLNIKTCSISIMYLQIHLALGVIFSCDACQVSQEKKIWLCAAAQHQWWPFFFFFLAFSYGINNSSLFMSMSNLISWTWKHIR